MLGHGDKECIELEVILFSQLSAGRLSVKQRLWDVSVCECHLAGKVYSRLADLGRRECKATERAIAATATFNTKMGEKKLK